MRKIIQLGLTLGAALTLGACSKHGDNQAAPADATENTAAGETAIDNGADGLGANSAAETNGVDANLAEPTDGTGATNAD